MYHRLEYQNLYIEIIKEDCMTLVYAFGYKIDMLLDKYYV